MDVFEVLLAYNVPVNMFAATVEHVYVFMIADVLITFSYLHLRRLNCVFQPSVPVLTVSFWAQLYCDMKDHVLNAGMTGIHI